MSKLFLDIFNLSITASWLIVAVIATRFIFRKRAPKWVNCLLWSLVGLRLLLPFTIESPFSLSVNREVINTDAIYGETVLETVPPADTVPPVDTAPPADDDIVIPPAVDTVPDDNYIQSGIGALDDRLNPVIKDTVSSAQPSEENVLQKVIDVASYIWLSGTALLIAYAVINYILLKYRVSSAIPCGNAVRKSERVDTPFILGFFRPRIYLPFGLSAETEECVVSHENAHLKRKDHLIKPLGYAILSVYWFNPLVWVAYILLCRDIESACDEKVIKNMNTEARQVYATALLECSIRKNYIAACPLAFGETGVKNRVKNTMNYRKPAFWVIISALLVCVIVSVLFLTSPGKAENDISETISEDSRQTESSDTSVTDVSDDVTSSDVSEYIGEVSVNDEVSSESSDTDVSEEISDEVSQEPAEEEKVEDQTRPQYLMQKNHQTHEKDVPRNHMAYEDSEITPIYVYVMNVGIMYDYAGNTMFGISQGDVGGRIGENYGAIKQAGLKVWICDINGNKIDYVYTNSSGMAKFEAYEGEYTFYFEGNDTFYARFAGSQKHSGVVKCDATYDLVYRDSDLTPGAIVRRVMTYEKNKYENFKIKVTDKDTGEPLEGVHIREFDIYTDANGCAEVQPLMHYYYADYSQDARPVHYYYLEGYDLGNDEGIDILDTECHVQLSKTKQYNITIKVVDGDTGEPISGVVVKHVEHYPCKEWSEQSYFNAEVTDENGVITGVISSEEFAYLEDSIMVRYTRAIETGTKVVSRSIALREEDSYYLVTIFHVVVRGSDDKMEIRKLTSEEMEELLN